MDEKAETKGQAKSNPRPDTAAQAKPEAGSAVTAAATDAVEAKPRPVIPLPLSRFEKNADTRNNRPWAEVPRGTEVGDLLQPGFWAHTAQYLRAGSTMEVHWEDGSQFAWLYVRAQGRTWANVSLMFHTLLRGAVRPHEQKNYEAIWSGQVERWMVVRKGDNAKIASGFDTEFAALRYIEEYVRKIAS